MHTRRGQMKSHFQVLRVKYGTPSGKDNASSALWSSQCWCFFVFIVWQRAVHHPQRSKDGQSETHMPTRESSEQKSIALSPPDMGTPALLRPTRAGASTNSNPELWDGALPYSQLIVVSNEVFSLVYSRHEQQYANHHIRPWHDDDADDAAADDDDDADDGGDDGGDSDDDRDDNDDDDVGAQAVYGFGRGFRALSNSFGGNPQGR